MLLNWSFLISNTDSGRKVADIRRYRFPYTLMSSPCRVHVVSIDGLANVYFNRLHDNLPPLEKKTVLNKLMMVRLSGTV